MYETFIIEDKKKKPPLSLIRIIGEILVGFAFGFTLLFLGYISTEFVESDEGLACFFLILLIAGCPVLYGIGCAAGIYFIGSIGKQTGSFSTTLIGCVVLGYIILIPSLPFFQSVEMSDMLTPTLLLWFIPSIVATICFNLTRRYKKTKPPVH